MSTTVYENFDLLIESSGESNGTQRSYRARVVNSPFGQAVTDFTLPFTHQELSSFFWLSGRLHRGLKFDIPEDEEEAERLDTKTFGHRLFDAAFAGDVGTCLLRSLDEADRGDAGLRIRLRLDKSVPELADLPWEYLYVPELKRFPVLSDKTPLVRYIEQMQREEPLQISPPLRVAVMLSNPSDVTQLNVEQEWKQLKDAVLELEARGLLSMQRIPAASLSALQQHLRTEETHIFHYIGHGLFDTAKNEGGLILEDGQGKADIVSAEKLATILHDHDPLRMIFLNACEGARAGKEDSSAGVAQTLVQQGIPAVLAMQFEVSDKAAIAMAYEFYKSTTDGLPADTAVAEARKAIFAQDNEMEWGTPVLFTRSPDNQILLFPQGDAQSVIEIQPWEPETILIQGGPFVMGQDGEDVTIEETPRHEITLSDFRMGKTPVTNAQYAEFLKHNKEQPEPARADWFLRKPPQDKLEHPVIGVTWHDAQSYCAWLTKETGRLYRLPTEAEWEKAARGPQGLVYPWGEAWVDGHCHIDEDGTAPINSYPLGASPYGCTDMLGNVEEWTSTLWGESRENSFPYPYVDNDGREDLEADQHWSRVYRVHRGGCFKDEPNEVRCTLRSGASETSKLSKRGFRVVVDLPNMI
ncbi:MAG: SUMF1/EgtB/PvdO family nonheme iron enzyme [Chloroflexota bacterium]